MVLISLLFYIFCWKIDHFLSVLSSLSDSNLFLLFCLSIDTGTSSILFAILGLSLNNPLSNDPDYSMHINIKVLLFVDVDDNWLALPDVDVVDGVPL